MKLFVNKEQIKSIEKSLAELNKEAKHNEDVIESILRADLSDKETMKRARFELQMIRLSIGHQVSEIRYALGKL